MVFSRLEELPVELIRIILNYLDDSEFFKVVTLVNKRFHRFTKELRKYKTHLKVESMGVDERKGDMNAYIKAQEWNSIEKLSLGMRYAKSENKEIYSRMLKCFFVRNVKKLELGPVFFKAFKEKIEDFKALNSFVINCNYNYERFGIDDVMEVLQPLTNRIQKLSLIGLSSEVLFDSKMYKFLKHAPVLEKLSVESLKCKGEQKKTFELFTINPRLRVFKLSGNYNLKKCAHEYCAYFLDCFNLKKLSINNSILLAIDSFFDFLTVISLKKLHLFPLLKLPLRINITLLKVVSTTEIKDLCLTITIESPEDLSNFQECLDAIKSLLSTSKFLKKLMLDIKGISTKAFKELSRILIAASIDGNLEMVNGLNLKYLLRHPSKLFDLKLHSSGLAYELFKTLITTSEALKIGNEILNNPEKKIISNALSTKKLIYRSGARILIILLTLKKELPDLQSIDFKFSPDFLINTSVFQTISSFTTLASLAIKSGTTLPNEFSKNLEEIADSNQNIQCLKLLISFQVNFSMSFDYIRKFANLQTLKLKVSKKNNLFNSIQCLKDLPVLTKLGFKSSYLNKSETLKIFNIITELPNLTSVSVSYNSISEIRGEFQDYESILSLYMDYFTSKRCFKKIKCMLWCGKLYVFKNIEEYFNRYEKILLQNIELQKFSVSFTDENKQIIQLSQFMRDRILINNFRGVKTNGYDFRTILEGKVGETDLRYYNRFIPDSKTVSYDSFNNSDAIFAVLLSDILKNRDTFIKKILHKMFNGIYSNDTLDFTLENPKIKKDSNLFFFNFISAFESISSIIFPNIDYTNFVITIHENIKKLSNLAHIELSDSPSIVGKLPNFISLLRYLITPTIRTLKLLDILFTVDISYIQTSMQYTNNWLLKLNYSKSDFKRVEMLLPQLRKSYKRKATFKLIYGKSSNGGYLIYGDFVDSEPIHLYNCDIVSMNFLTKLKVDEVCEVINIVEQTNSIKMLGFCGEFWGYRYTYCINSLVQLFSNGKLKKFRAAKFCWNRKHILSLSNYLDCKGQELKPIDLYIITQLVQENFFSTITCFDLSNNEILIKSSIPAIIEFVQAVHPRMVVALNIGLTDLSAKSARYLTQSLSYSNIQLS